MSTSNRPTNTDITNSTDNGSIYPSERALSPVLSVSDLRKDFWTGDECVHALNGVSLSVAAGSFVAVMGASGSGKSTLLHLVAGLDDPTSGSIHIDGRDLASVSDRERTLFRRRRLGLVFQAYNLLPTLTAWENVALPAMLDGGPEDDIEKKSLSLLNRVSLGHRKDHRPQALSGGEQQRVAIARALMNDPALLLADEPTGNLDTEHGAAIWRLLAALVQEHGRTVVAVTHDADGAAHAHRVLMLRDGCLVGEIEPNGEDRAATVAHSYRELVG